MSFCSPRRRLLVFAVFGLCLASDLPFANAAPPAVARVPLVIDELRADRTVPWPITTGVPFAQGALASEEQCRLVDDTAAEQPLQSRVAATWDAEKKSIRWLTIDFIAQPGRKYQLEFGANVKRGKFGSPLKTNAETTISTGVLQAKFSATGPAALAAVSIDLNSDAKFAGDEQIAAGSADGDHVLVDQDGKSWSSKADGADRKVVVECDGPVRTCVRVDGWYTGPGDRRIVGYRTRYHFFAGLPLIKVIDEFCIVGSTRGVQFADIALPLELKLDQTTARAMATTVEPDPQQVGWIDAKASERVSLVQKTYRHYGNQECQAVKIQGETTRKETSLGERMNNWLQVSDKRVAVTGSLRWLWQQFPKEWEVSNDRLTLHLWSPQAGKFDFSEQGLRDFLGEAGQKYLLNWSGTRAPRTPIENFFFFAGRHALERDGADGLGINKHHEVWYHFAPAAQAKAGQEYGDLVERRPLCLGSGEYNCGTGVFGTLAARPNKSPYEAAVDRIFELERYAQDAFGDYGWWLFGSGPHYSYQWDAETKKHYADPRRFEYHTYQRETQLWWNYLRSGERKFYDWAFPSENHWVDIAVSHSPTKYSTEWRGGQKQDAKLEYRPGDWSIDSPLHYVRHHDTGEAWLRSAPQFWASYHRTLETTTLAYYLTGDERYNDVINFWRDYWGVLAGVRSDSKDVPSYHREQLWFQPTKPGEPTRTWAEMLRDYAPFQSGSRHQMTLLFNLSTLYEHTWDPVIGRVAREYADAFLDPSAPNGTWQCHDHRLPANADSPMLAHYWSGALWKYARATGDPRMPEVLKKYFTACCEADPYGGDVGIYSNQQISWAWHFLRDPRALVASQFQLDRLLVNARPLEKPEELGERIYNPYSPIMALATVPRSIGALEAAERMKIKPPQTPPLMPQRTMLAVRREQNAKLNGVLWGWDEKPAAFDGDGDPIELNLRTEKHRSHLQPYDRALPGYAVYRHAFAAEPSADSRWLVIAPRIETGLVELDTSEPVWCWAGEPVRIDAGQSWHWPVPSDLNEVIIESAQPALLRFNGAPADGGIVKNQAKVKLATPGIEISSAAGQPIWFRLVAPETTSLWITSGKHAKTAGTPPPVPKQLIAQRRPEEVDLTQTLIPGKFGQALLMVFGRELHVPDELPGDDGQPRRLSDEKQGTFEFWIRKLWDDRLTLGPRTLEVLDNGVQQAPLPIGIPLREWTHMAISWRPLELDPARTLLHVYINGVDYGNYRNLFWEGYAQPPGFRVREWLKEFVLRTGPGSVFALDDVRISRVPRYFDPALRFGRQQTFNTFTFTPPTRPSEFDDRTVLQLSFDGDMQARTIRGKQLETKLKLEPKPK